MLKVHIDCKEINYLIVDSKGRITVSGEKEEENDTFIPGLMKISTIKVGSCPKIQFICQKNESLRSADYCKETTLNYKVLKVEEC